MAFDAYTFTAVDNEGREIECETLFTFVDDDTDKHYIVYTDRTLDENGFTKVYASVYEERGEGKLQLFPIETAEEWAQIEKILEEIQQDDDCDDCDCDCEDDTCGCSCNGDPECDCDCNKHED